jgi:hypothetical protein
MNLADDIAVWDSKDFTHINRVYADHFDRPDFIPALIAHCASESHQDGATWLLKHAIDEGDLVPVAIDPDLLAEFCSNLPRLTRWPAQLHALQILSVVQIPRPAAASVESFARTCMTSRKTFVRAWAYTALYAATLHDPKKDTKTVRLLNDTLNDDSAPASVKARIRNTLKSG